MATSDVCDEVHDLVSLARNDNELQGLPVKPRVSPQASKIKFKKFVQNNPSKPKQYI